MRTLTPGRTSASPRLPLGRVVGAGTLLILVYLAVRSFDGVAQALFLVLFGVLLAILIDVPTSALAQRMPRPVALLLVMLAFVALLVGNVVIVAPRVSAQLALLGHAVSRGGARAGELWARIAPREAATWAAMRDRLVAALPSMATRLVPFVSGTVSLLGSVLVVFAVALFVAVDPQAELRWLARLVPERHEDVYWELARRLGVSLRQWLLGMIVSLAIVATFTGLGLLVVRVPAWLALALLTFVTGFVPYLGSFFTGLLVLGAGLAVSAKTALIAIIIFIVGQVLHGVLIAPLVNRQAVRMPPALLLPWQIVMVASFGVSGILAAQPLLAIAMVVIDYVYVERRLGRRS